MQKFPVAFGRFNWQLSIIALVLIAPSPVRADTQKAPQLSEIKLPINSAQLQVQTQTSTNLANLEPRSEVQVVLITGVRANPTDTDVEVILQTTQGEQLQITNRSSGNNYIADIPGAQLRLPSGNAFTFRSENPIEGITEITVTNLDGNTVRVAVAGEAALPTVELFDSNEGLIFGIVTAASAAQQPQTPAESDELIEILVTGEQDGYRTPNVATVTRTDTPLRDIPQSIQIIPQEVLRDQNADIVRALLNAPSVRNSAPANFDSLRIQVRGLSTSPTLNGFKDSLSSNVGPELTGIERIEVLQGPNAILFGSSSPGGTVNFATKQPLQDPFYFVEATVGSFNFYRSEVDLSGPLDDAGRVLYRLNASYRDQEFFLDLSRTQNFVIAPAVSIALGENTNLTIEGIYKDLDLERTTFGLPAVGTVLPNPNGRIPNNRNVNEGILYAEGSRVGYTLEHNFSEDWSLRNAFQYSRYYSTYTDPNGGTFPIGLLPDNRTMERVYLNEAYDQRDYRLSTNVVGRFATGSIQHQLLFGVDLGRQTLDSNGQRREIAPLDLFNPIHGQLPGAIISGSGYDSDSIIDELGILLQDQVAIADNLKLLLSGRFDIFSQTNENIITNTETSQSGSAFSPRLGIVYQPIPPISLYANYSQSFQPAIGRAFDDSTFEPTRGTQFEVGVKADLNDRLSTTLALYVITQSNVLTEDPENLGFSVQTGKQRSQGIELSLAGEILPGWNVFASYAYNDARVTEDNVIPVGNRIQRTTPHAASLWTTYEIQQGELQGLGFGLGLFFVGDRPGDVDNTFEVPSYLTTDAAIFYERNSFRAALNFKNLFNVDYFEGVFNRNRVFPGAPFTLEGTVSWTF